MRPRQEGTMTGGRLSIYGTSPRDKGIVLQRHRPEAQTDVYHFHPSLEINFLQNCDMTYSFSGEEVELKRDRICVFWAAHPHRATGVNNDGVITNAYVSLSEFLKWSLPAEFRNKILSGAVLCAKSKLDGDRAMADRWAAELDNTDPEWQRLHALEIHTRLYRLAIDGWEVLLDPKRSAPPTLIGGNASVQFEKMLMFVAHHFADRISIADVAAQADISPNYAISLFRKMLGQTIKEHITDMRIFHAKMLLSESDRKILTIAMDCGFGSLSSFYEAFHNRTGFSPAAFRDGAGRAILNARSGDDFGPTGSENVDDAA